MTKYSFENLNLLNEVRPVIKNKEVLEVYNQLLNDNFMKYLKTVDVDNLDAVLRLTLNILPNTNFKRDEYLACLFKNLKGSKNTVKIFELLNDKFTVKEILGYINPFKEVLESKKTTNKKLLSIINYDEVFNQLVKLTNSKNLSNYAFDNENLNKEEFETNYKKLLGYQKDVLEFKLGNEDYFINQEINLNLFKEINDSINLEKDALKNIKNLTKGLVEKKIINGDYQAVLVSLCIKLSDVLASKYDLNDNLLSERLVKAKKQKLIDKNILDDLHELRKCRNGIVHPEQGRKPYNADDLRRWMDEVFEIEVVKK